MHRIGVIGGSGLYEMAGLTDLREEVVDTPFGQPSDALIHGRLGDVEMVFLARHGRGHRYNPSEVNYRANVYALKQAGVRFVISVSAVGSLKAEIVPGHVVLVDQFIDRTKARHATFFEGGIVAHVGFGDPVCPTLRRYLGRAADQVRATWHDGGTYVCMEGPLFSTRAESELYRSWGASVIGMTNLPEAKLAREAELSYATLAMATDYDCWHPEHDAVTVEAVVATLHKNVHVAQQIIATAAPVAAAHEGDLPAWNALRNAIMTRRELIPEQKARDLRPLVGRYL